MTALALLGALLAGFITGVAVTLVGIFAAIRRADEALKRYGED